MSRLVCLRCERPQTVCYCHLLPAIDNRWPVVILQHVLESRHAVNTARIAQLSLLRCTTLAATDTTIFKSSSLAVCNAAPAPVLIYPGEHSRPLAELDVSTPAPLLFIDATWRKSRRLLLQSPWLQSLDCYGFTAEGSGRYRIRKASQPGYRSTLEAIVTVLSHLEEEPFTRMLAVMDWMVEQQLGAMDPETRRKNYPEAP